MLKAVSVFLFITLYLVSCKSSEQRITQDNYGRNVIYSGISNIVQIRRDSHNKEPLVVWSDSALVTNVDSSSYSIIPKMRYGQMNVFVKAGDLIDTLNFQVVRILSFTCEWSTELLRSDKKTWTSSEFSTFKHLQPKLNQFAWQNFRYDIKSYTLTRRHEGKIVSTRKYSRNDRSSGQSIRYLTGVATNGDLYSFTDIWLLVGDSTTGYFVDVPDQHILIED